MQTLGFNFGVQEGVGPVSYSFLAGEDVTGFSASMKFRQSILAAVDLTLTSGVGVTVGGADGAFSFTLSVANITTLVTACASSGSGSELFDLIFTRGDGSTGKALSGICFVQRSVSR